jgi:DNA polymerase I-like protein with 3'-5' exonuclease and polymerase domains
VHQNALSFDDLKASVEIIKDTADAKKILNSLAKEEGYLAFDYETTGLKPDDERQKIVSVSLCWNKRRTVAFKMSEELKESLSLVLKNGKLKKIASNLKFEERWTRAKLGHGVKGWYWDTMLAAHLIDNRSHISSIKFQAFVLLGVADYSSHVDEYLKSVGDSDYNRIEELNEDELLLYNGLDSLLEFLVMKRQKEIVRGQE